MNLSIVTHLRQPAALSLIQYWNAHGDGHSSVERPIILAACGDLEAALYNGEIEVIHTTMDQGEISGAMQRLIERACHCYQLELRHAQEDREPVAHILSSAAQLQTISLVVLDGSQGQAADVLSMIERVIHSYGATC